MSDVNLGEWLVGIAFHPADTEEKQLAHEAVRQQVAALGTVLHALLPAGRDKAMAFGYLEDVLMRANRSLAVGGGPNRGMRADTLRGLIAAGPLANDPRIEQYKQEQRGEGVGAIASGEAWGTPTISG